MTATDLLIAVREDLYNAGTTCDGHPFHAVLYYVVAEASNGARWAHSAVFRGARREVCEYTGDPVIVDLRPEASAAVERLAARIQAHLDAGGKLDGLHWSEIDPAYGSDAYQVLDEMHFFKEREKAEDRAGH